MSAISYEYLDKVKKLYNDDKKSMLEIASIFGVSVDSVVYFMRKNNIKRRTPAQTFKIKFNEKPLSYLRKVPESDYEKLLESMGVMLYWAEGYKTNKSSGVDFANSDPSMILLFITFLRKCFCINEQRLRIFLYMYSDQNSKDLIRFWSSLTAIPVSQFSKPYIKTSREILTNKVKMKYGLIHIRYNDIRLLSELKKLIESYKSRYAPVV